MGVYEERMLDGYYLRWLDLPLVCIKLPPCEGMTQKVRQFAECNHVLIHFVFILSILIAYK